MELHKISIQDVLVNLPDIELVNFKKQFAGNDYDLYIQAVGFESRTIGIVDQLSKLNNTKAGKLEIKIEEAILINYETNVEDNLFHGKQLKKILAPFTELISSFDLNSSFDEIIRNKILSLLKAKKKLKILIDISTMSSRLILLLTRLLFQENIELIILFTEGLLYHPTEKQFEQIANNANGDGQSQTYGVSKVVISPDYNGGTKENQDLVICFPSFAAERTEAIVTYIDDLILKHRDKERLIWIVGDPHLEDEQAKVNRQNIQIQINNIPDDHKIYKVCTFDYKKTLEVLDHIYKDVYYKYHINISDLGSKMQSLGIALFCSLRRDVTVYYSEPIKYNPTYYSEGIKNYWMINVGTTSKVLEELFRVDKIELKAKSNSPL